LILGGLPVCNTPFDLLTVSIAQYRIYVYVCEPRTVLNLYVVNRDALGRGFDGVRGCALDGGDSAGRTLCELGDAGAKEAKGEGGFTAPDFEGE